MKISLIITTLNEAETIKPLLDSVFEQSLTPSEIIIIDAGSTDGTVEILKQYPITHRVCDRGTNRSVARNLGIKLAKNEIIAVTDAGCILDPNWLEYIAAPFSQKDTQAVAGFYLPVITNSFQEALSCFVCSQVTKVKPGFLPSSRSVAFKKDVWLKTRGYPDDLNYCEDLAFDQKVISQGYKFKVAPKAIVYWPQRKSLFQALTQFYRYAYGDGLVFFSKLQTHSGKIVLLYLRYLALIVGLIVFLIEPRLLPIVFVAYCLYLCRPMIVYRNRIKSIRGYLWVPVIKLTADLAVMSGSFTGILAGRSVR